MKASLALPLVLGLGLVVPMAAYAEDSRPGTPAGGVSAAAPTPNQNSGTGATAPGSRGAATERREGLSRSKSDCVKTGCVDNGGS
jgi:hypothetical protein